VRVRSVLDFLWEQGEDEVFVSITAHGGTVAAILANVGHREFKLQTGGMIPVVVRGIRVNGDNVLFFPKGVGGSW
jgi:hypothetical protein